MLFNKNRNQMLKSKKTSENHHFDEKNRRIEEFTEAYLWKITSTHWKHGMK